jgi:hypothetical protein
VSKVYKADLLEDGRIGVVEAEIVEETDDCIVLGKRHWIFKDRIEKRTEGFCRTRQDAIELFIDQTTGDVKDMMDGVRRLERRIDQAKELLRSTGSP